MCLTHVLTIIQPQKRLICLINSLIQPFKVSSYNLVQRKLILRNTLIKIVSKIVCKTAKLILNIKLRIPIFILRKHA